MRALFRHLRDRFFDRHRIGTSLLPTGSAEPHGIDALGRPLLARGMESSSASPLEKVRAMLARIRRVALELALIMDRHPSSPKKGGASARKNGWRPDAARVRLAEGCYRHCPPIPSSGPGRLQRNPAEIAQRPRQHPCQSRFAIGQ
jgi:hypothetical protein